MCFSNHFLIKKERGTNHKQKTNNQTNRNTTTTSRNFFFFFNLLKYFKLLLNRSNLHELEHMEKWT